jgi:hypothetical protein
VSIKAVSYYLLECDGCGAQCGDRGEYGEYSAMADQGSAIDLALDEGWSTDGEKHHCQRCPAIARCDECGKPAGDGVLDRDGLCAACDAEVQKDAPVPGVTP